VCSSDLLKANFEASTRRPKAAPAA